MPPETSLNADQSKLQKLTADHAKRLTRFLDQHFTPPEGFPPSHQRLLASIRYSLLQDGSKRFRPVLAMLVTEALGVSCEAVLPFAAAVECVHTYSLIHDDLPAMDDDDVRRGQPTNHRKFDEATAILAGDALLSEAFQLIADHYRTDPAKAVTAISELARASGLRGMVGGQVIDIAAQNARPTRLEDAHQKSQQKTSQTSAATGLVTLSELKLMHRLKTGALIVAAVRGSAQLAGASAQDLTHLTQFADDLGLAFQVADDLLDFDESAPEPGSYPVLIGRVQTLSFLEELTQSCLNSLVKFGSQAEPLRSIALYNQSRLT